MAFKLKNNELKKIIGQLKNSATMHAKQAKKLQSALPKRMGDFKHSDAPDAKGKFRDLSPSALASWLIKTRDGNLKKIIGSLNQQYVFNRGKKPAYARKMKTVMNIVRKRLGKKEDSPLKRKDPLVGTGKKPKGSGRRLYTDENPKDTVGIKFATVADARKTINKVMNINKPYARKVQILTVLEQRAKVMGKMEQARLAKSAKATLKRKNKDV